MGNIGNTSVTATRVFGPKMRGVTYVTERKIPSVTLKAMRLRALGQKVGVTERAQTLL